MKIGVITSGFEMLGLFKFLNKYNYEFEIYIDWNNYPYGDKDIVHNISNIQKGISYLENLKVEHIILPPIYELFIKNSKIIRLWENYFLNKCLSNSLVGKLGFIGDWVDIKNIENKLGKLFEKYELNNNQKNINKFNKNFPIRKKEVGLWKLYLNKLGARDPMVRKTIKYDIRYFKDAMVDTIIPLNWGYLDFENIIKSKLNSKKIKFHGKKEVNEIFDEIIGPIESTKEKYKINIHHNGNIEIFQAQKKRIWLLERGKEIKIKFNKIA